MALFRTGLRCFTSGNLQVPLKYLRNTYASVEKVTHTGQKYDEDDWKKVRFIDGIKLVNDNIAAKLIDEIPPKEVSQRVISCDGGGGALGHPKVFINLDKPGAHACGYCGLRFKKKEHH
ncbi:NADH dehydrogenase [ubiquinone] iron-sulfur protein 6, mitochondrial isoform X1 [Hydra vulgaris]|uniref:NADH dehydrogenase [ubiquinone] iron-sulfur protein 6, mitochondrial isoform X1 n=1 Tax=Hydra vulgaris TaxID=6087 RepID=UPI001F5E89B9|nr:NADH dehydrogenase [ubiquinone] iron-sulfur protein 6, mitochondrial [Hydra vulgaris]